MHAVFVIAHPDDELVTFGPAFMRHVIQGEKVTVICVTQVTDVWRNAAFLQMCSKLNVQAHMLGYPDKIDEEIFDEATVEKLYLILHKLEFDRIYTHCLISGDRGMHKHHKNVALMLRDAALQLPDTGDKIYHLYHEGFIDNPLVHRLNLSEYQVYIALLRETYLRELEYLMPDKYPAVFSQMYYQVADKTIRERVLPQYLLYVKGEKNFDQPVDPCATAESWYEGWKRHDWLLPYVKQHIIPKFDNYVILDVGTGEGYTTNEVLRVLKQKPQHIYLYDKYVAPHDAILCNINTIAPTSYVRELPDLADKTVLVTAFASLCWMSPTEVAQILKQASVVIFDSMHDDLLSYLYDQFEVNTKNDMHFVLDNWLTLDNDKTGLYHLHVDFCEFGFAVRKNDDL